jgi:hypothetical protein
MTSRKHQEGEDQQYLNTVGAACEGLVERWSAGAERGADVNDSWAGLDSWKNFSPSCGVLEPLSASLDLLLSQASRNTQTGSAHLDMLLLLHDWNSLL